MLPCSIRSSRTVILCDTLLPLGRVWEHQQFSPSTVRRRPRRRHHRGGGDNDRDRDHDDDRACDLRAHQSTCICPTTTKSPAAADKSFFRSQKSEKRRRNT